MSRVIISMHLDQVSIETIKKTSIPDFSKLDYLRDGSSLQNQVWSFFESSQLISRLQQYNPYLAGTIPLGIETPSSDLDILGQTNDFDRTFDDLYLKFKNELSFDIKITSDKNKMPALLCNFFKEPFPVEIFIQNIPPNQQIAARHLRAEARLLHFFGDSARVAIQKLKLNGMKTEPAFAHYFSIQGDPYEALLQWD